MEWIILIIIIIGALSLLGSVFGACEHKEVIEALSFFLYL